MYKGRKMNTTEQITGILIFIKKSLNLPHDLETKVPLKKILEYK